MLPLYINSLSDKKDGNDIQLDIYFLTRKALKIQKYLSRKNEKFLLWKEISAGLYNFCVFRPMLIFMTKIF